MKVLQVVDGTGWGGTKEQVYLTTRELKNKGIDVHIALNQDYTQMIQKLKPYNIPIHFFEDNKPNPRYRWSNYRRLIDIVNNNKFDVVIANSPKSMDYVALSTYFFNPKPKIVAVRRSGRVPSLLSKIIKYSKADKIVVVSQEVKNILEKENFFPNKLITIKSGVDLSRFKPDTQIREKVRKELNIPPHAKLFINVANWQLQVKAQDKLIESFSKLNCENCFLILVGLDTDKYGKEFARKFGIENRVIGLGFREDVPDLLNASDFFLLSSNLEGIAGSLLQAMATGKVVLSTLAGGIGEYLIDGYNGFAVDVGDFENFTKKLNYLLNLSQEDYDRISKNAVETAKEYSIEKTAEGYIKLFEELISG
ncbi:MAG: glycosyltransferase family 4 protein [Hydrogenothermaceae bacterium]|nr:glycosyltransferase family 4 protein [Hydrogenothermaceae bacterium]